MNANALVNVTPNNLINVEALAQTESIKYTCYGIGSLDCPSSEDKVKFIR